ncbi:MAG: CBS domain-containing protein [Bacteroidetes bacterium]|nr:CBS domain-containing protein [Bacteroidota bacterium]
MLALELMTDDIPPLKTSDTGVKALAWMDELRVSHLPIVNNVAFLGLISENDILDLNAPNDPIGNHTLSLVRPFVYSHQHFYEVLRMLSQHKLSLIPVLDEQEHFLGSIKLSTLLEKFADMASLKEPGGVIVLELNTNDYYLAEIAKIVESNDAKILSLYISSPTDSTKLEVTLKINRADLSSILQTFYRFNYSVKNTIHESEGDTEMKDRFDSFLSYLNV